MLDDNEFKTRLKLLADSGSVFEGWDTVIGELIEAYYPWVNLRQDRVLRCIIHVIWDVGFSNAMYVEVAARLKHKEKELFPTTKSIRQTVKELCEKGVTRSKIATFETYDNSATLLLGTSRCKVLELSEKFRTETITAMAEVFHSTMRRYFSPEKK